ncbi:CELSR2 [Branchiostoma lanceolatum]|uniref:CELSR2 protein n=1 Tax=Branchiostoma lanceolatum TaxID=7740 RepID=A0A8J9YR54_BRALA|nr:CELSR2 [Branchiostoma lanceolatum]
MVRGCRHLAGFLLLLSEMAAHVTRGTTPYPDATTTGEPPQYATTSTADMFLLSNVTAVDNQGLLYSDLVREIMVDIPATSTIGDLVVDMTTLQTSNVSNVTYVLMCCTYDVFTLRTDGKVLVTSELDFNTQYSIPVAELDSFGTILAVYVIHVSLTSDVTLYKDPDGLCNTTSFFVTMEENSNMVSVDLGSLMNQSLSGLQFSLVPGGDADRFSIDPSSGVLTPNSPLDREEKDTLVFRIAMATRYDVTFATVTVTVTDINDNAPTLVETWSSEYILQSTPINSIVGLVRAEDPDAGENATLTYTIVAETGEDFSELFFINNVTGVITVISNFKVIREHIPLKVTIAPVPVGDVAPAGL